MNGKELSEMDEPFFYIQAVLPANGFDMNQEIKREDDFFNQRVIFTQEDSHGK